MRRLGALTRGFEGIVEGEIDGVVGRNRFGEVAITIEDEGGVAS